MDTSARSILTPTSSSFLAAPLNNVSLKSSTASRAPRGEKKCSASRSALPTAPAF